MESNNTFKHLLNPFYVRASEAEDRLAKLEAVVAGGIKDSGNEEHLALIKELRSKLDIAGEERVAENEKVMKEVESLKTENAKLKLEAVAKRDKDSGNEEHLELIKELQSKLDIAVAENKKAMKEMESLKTENAKLNYRIIHLVRAVKEGDAKLERFKNGDSREAK